MRVAVLFSGGKDSTYAIWIVQHQGWDITALITVKPRMVDSLMFHYPNVDWTRLQAESMQLPQTMATTTGENELKVFEKSLVELKEKRGIEGLVTGALASDYQKTRFDNICDSVGLKSYSPLWHKTPTTIVQDLKRGGFQVVMTRVAAAGLERSWLGKKLTSQDWDKLTELSKMHGMHLSGEGGEYETFVIDAPNFEKRLMIEKGNVSWDGQSGTFTIEKASLRDKLGK